MTTVVVTHAVGNMQTWLGGGEERTKIFSGFCTGHRIFKHSNQDSVSIVFEGVDLDKMKAILGSPEAAEGKAKHTVIDPIEVYVEVEGGA
ncbi:hypothetical protein OEW28_14855 [Defluviimonas sp. WL0002]|uniref:Uncharacterized protein n=1 Tax=Albidovulum marisflavi TaxID=2984159 RepID=A0ABT2ZFL2_9RHOB|nr:hypothetical protein [Defluviimonas sp. WL0002]MCV2869909.1 hypothetical protein [Defluviimonas sp. WL0002]